MPSSEVDTAQALAGKLRDIMIAAGGLLGANAKQFPQEHPTYYHLARECLRQMEWARSGWVVRIDSNGSPFYSEAPPESELTLAPEDWTPYASK